MIKLKNNKDIKYIKKAIKIGERILRKIRKYIKPGITTLELNLIVEKMIKKMGAKPSFKGFQNYPFATCMSIDEEIIHGFPSNRKLKDGEILKIDIGINYKNYYSDQADTIIVGGAAFTKEEFRLIYGTRSALTFAIKEALIGKTIGDISKVIEETAKDFKLGILKDFCGHGVGFNVHESPKIPNIIGIDKDVVLQKGIVIAIEPMFILGNGNYRKKENGWTIEVNGLAAHFERTIII